MIFCVADVKQKNGVQVERRNRRALGDIGNFVTGPTVVDVGKPQTRPMTRFISLPYLYLSAYLSVINSILTRCFLNLIRTFRAQLVANAQLAVADKNVKVYAVSFMFNKLNQKEVFMCLKLVVFFCYCFNPIAESASRS